MWILTAVLLVSLTLVAGAAEANPKLDKDAAQWLREVHLLILPEEELAFRGLTNPEDRKEFQRIFWARRDPEPATAVNEWEESNLRGRKRADELFALPGSRGSETGCGQVLLLLGEPLEIEGAGPGEIAGRGAREQFNSLEPMREGSRRPETWVYRSRTGDPVTFTGGELRIAFDESCRFSEGGRVLEDLRRVAAARITQPALDYRKDTSGRLVPLNALRASSGSAGSGGAARALLESKRTDFPMALEPKLLLRAQAGQAYAAGLVRADARGLGPDSGGARIVGTVAVQAVPSTGPASDLVERTVSAAAGPDGAIVAAYGVSLKPGRYTLRVALLLPGGKGSVAGLPLDVPDFDAPGLKATGLVVYPDEPVPQDAQDPYAALTVGPLRLRPRFGNSFSKSDAIQVVSVLYGAQTDATTGKAVLRARFSISKDGKPVAKAQDQVFETAMAVASIGPIPLGGFAPGPHQVRLEVRDEVAGTTAVQEAAFEVRE